MANYANEVLAALQVESPRRRRRTTFIQAARIEEMQLRKARCWKHKLLHKKPIMTAVGFEPTPFRTSA